MQQTLQLKAITISIINSHLGMSDKIFLHPLYLQHYQHKKSFKALRASTHVYHYRHLTW